MCYFRCRWNGSRVECRILEAGAKTEKLLLTGNVLYILEIDNFGEIEASILDVSNPMVLVSTEDIGMKGTELQKDINKNKEVMDLLEKIRGTAACLMRFAKDLADTKANSPVVSKIGFVAITNTFTDIVGKTVNSEDMYVCARMISIFKYHNVCPLI